MDYIFHRGHIDSDTHRFIPDDFPSDAVPPRLDDLLASGAKIVEGGILTTTHNPLHTLLALGVFAGIAWLAWGKVFSGKI